MRILRRILWVFAILNILTVLFYIISGIDSYICRLIFNSHLNLFFGYYAVIAFSHIASAGLALSAVLAVHSKHTNRAILKSDIVLIILYIVFTIISVSIWSLFTYLIND